ncbi:MAG TPA: arylsulfotransferase family protein [Sphingomonas sp.]
MARSDSAATERREKPFLARRVPLWTLVLAANLGLILTVAVAALARSAEKHGKLGAAAVQIAEIPDTIGDWWKGAAPFAAPPYQKLPAGFRRNTLRSFVDPGYALITPYDTRRGRATIQLIRLSDGKMLKEWLPDVAAINARSHFHSAIVDLYRDKSVDRMRPMHPMLLGNGDLLIHDNTPLARIDGCGRPRWVIDGIFHHSLERAADGTLWIPYRLARSNVPGVGAKFADEAPAQIDEQGRLIRVERLIEILDRNDLGGLWRGRPYEEDPFHLNDIEPVLSSGPYWRQGDLILSLRNMSLIALYRPSTGRILWTRAGPWSAQHDVSILDDHRIMVFDNHVSWGAAGRRVDGNSRLLIYDFATDKLTSPLANTFARRGILTATQGRATPLSNGDVMVEETERGQLMRIAPDGSLRWRYVSADPSGRRLWLSWSRYLDPNDRGVLSAVKAATTREQCT